MDYLSRIRHGRNLRIRYSKTKRRSGCNRIYSSSLCVALRAAVAKRKRHQNLSSHTHPSPNPCSVTIATMGFHYLIRIFTYRDYTPLSTYLLMLERESMEVINVTVHRAENKLFYAIAVNTPMKSELEIDLLRNKLYRLASTKSELRTVE